MKRFTDIVRNEINSREFKMPTLDMDIPNINMPNMPNMSMNLGISDSLNDAKAKLSSVIASSSSDTKSKEAKKKQQIALVISLLDDVRLQCPQTHAGLVIVCTAATLSPLYSKGIKFTWFRMKQDCEQFIKVDESFNGWYSPNIDDIGSKICVQIQDNYDEGLSRYLETGLIEADQLLCSLVEPAIEKGSYRTHNNIISMGIEEDTSMGEYTAPDSFAEIKRKRSNLSSNVAYVELKDECYIEVDVDGIFIGFNNCDSSSQDIRNKNRIGLHLISSEHITVQCSQPLSIIVTIKVIRECYNCNATTENVTTDDDASLTPEPVLNTENNDDNAVKPVICPWSYIRTSVGDSDQPADETELEASIFASTLVLLEQFLQSIPETTNEIKLCISCSDRTERDCLAACIRSLVCQRAGLSIENRLKSLPWRSSETGEKVNLNTISETGSEMIKRLKLLEQENFRLHKMVEMSKEEIESNRLPLSSLDETSADTNKDINNDNNTDNTSTNDGLKIIENANNSSVKILELENKISILQRRELENIKIREELETKHAKTISTLTNLTQESNKCQQELSELQKEHSTAMTTNEQLKIEKDKLELIKTEFANTVSQKNEENKEFSNAVAEKDKLLGTQNEEILSLKQRLDAFIEKEKELEELKRKSMQQDELLEKKVIELESLISTSDELKKQNSDMKISYEEQKKRLEKLEEMEKSFSDVQARADRLAGEINHQNKRAESQAKDLKKIIKENALTISEFEKALTRKSNECQELESRINQLVDLEQGVTDRESITARLNKGLSEISIPRINIPSPSKFISSTSSPTSATATTTTTTTSTGTSITEGGYKLKEKMKNFLSTKVSIPFSGDSSMSIASNNNNNEYNSNNELSGEISKRE